MNQDDDKPLDRRSFFTLGLKKTAKAAIDVAKTRAEQKTQYFIRPPFALAELDFLIKCTRCGECIAACPHNIIFPLSARLGVEVVSTPALDLQNGACHLCEDWPCVTACQDGALKQPPPEAETNAEETALAVPRPLPHLAMARISARSCLPYMGPECGACGSVCPVAGAIKWDMTRPTINAQRCIGCALCREACITSPKSVHIQPVSPSNSVPSQKTA